MYCMQFDMFANHISCGAGSFIDKPLYHKEAIVSPEHIK